MKYKKIVIKIGTSILAKTDGSIDQSSIERITSQVAYLLDEGVKVILVSSGAIGAGLGVMGLRGVPRSLPDLQAIAAIGQSELMRLYATAFKKRGYVVGQVLLTQEDFDQRHRYLNIKYTIETLVAKQVVPIVNENDTVSTDEIKCGDNDRLSSLVADLVAAEALIILTDVDGFYTKEGKVIGIVEDITEDMIKLAGKKGTFFTKGGMSTKLEAAKRAVNSGIECFIANGKRNNIILNIVESHPRRKCTFTYFKAKPTRQRAKKRWIAYSSKVKGKIIVDDGAKKALIANHKSLLSSGIIKKEGNFEVGDVVAIVDSKQKEFARGLTNYSSREIDRIRGLKTNEIQKSLGHKDHDEVVHRDNMVIL